MMQIVLSYADLRLLKLESCTCLQRIIKHTDRLNSPSQNNNIKS